jgi:hypothetical protein
MFRASNAVRMSVSDPVDVRAKKENINDVLGDI